MHRSCIEWLQPSIGWERSWGVSSGGLFINNFIFMMQTCFPLHCNAHHASNQWPTVLDDCNQPLDGSSLRQRVASGVDGALSALTENATSCRHRHRHRQTQTQTQDVTLVWFVFCFWWDKTLSFTSQNYFLFLVRHSIVRILIVMAWPTNACCKKKGDSLITICKFSWAFPTCSYAA